MQIHKMTLRKLYEFVLSPDGELRVDVLAAIRDRSQPDVLAALPRLEADIAAGRHPRQPDGADWREDWQSLNLWTIFKEIAPGYTAGIFGQGDAVKIEGWRHAGVMGEADDGEVLFRRTLPLDTTPDDALTAAVGMFNRIGSTAIPH